MEQPRRVTGWAGTLWEGPMPEALDYMFHANTLHLCLTFTMLPK